MTDTTHDEAVRQLRQASKDKQLWGLLTYFLPPLVVVFLPLWLLAIRREKRRIVEVAELADIRTQGRTDGAVRREVGRHIGNEQVAKNSYGPAVVAALVLAVIVFVVVRVMMAQ